jgi:hypothetical protein
MNLSKVNVQSKIVDVNDRLGNNFLKRMQGTTKMIYDTLAIDGSKEYVFFRDTNSRTFPFTNVKSDSLPVSESLAIQRISLVIITVTDATGVITAFTPIGAASSNELPLLFSELSVSVGNEVVMKPITVQHFAPEFNKNACNADSNVFEMNTDLVIPPQLDFDFTVRAPNHGTNAQTGSTDYLRIVIEGVGAQFNAKANF